MARPSEEDFIARVVVDAALKVHSALGPGLLESVYEACLAHDLGKAGRQIQRQLTCPVRYGEVEVDAGFRLDLVIDNLVILEVKSVDKLIPVHTAQLLTYLKLTNRKLGLLLNFNVPHMRDGIKRVANGL
jgi:GxxExxY protein